MTRQIDTEEKKDDKSISSNGVGFLSEVTQTGEQFSATFEDEGFFDDITNVVSSAKDIIAEEAKEAMTSVVANIAIEGVKTVAQGVVDTVGEVISNIDL